MVSMMAAADSDSHIAVFSSLPSQELLDSLAPVVRSNILSSSKSPAPAPEILTFDNHTHILVWKFTPEQQEMLKDHKDLIGLETNQIVRIAPFPVMGQSNNVGEQGSDDANANIYPTPSKSPNVEEQGSDAPNLDGSAGQITNAYLNGTRMSTQVNVPNWGLARISQKYLPLQTDYTYPNSSGEGVDVYVIDTGINIEHQEFGGRASWGLTTVENSGDIDDNGHGTFVAGIVGGALFGVAKEALDASGSGSVSDILYGLQYVIKAAKVSGNKSRSVVNLSLGTQKSTALDQAVTALVNAGIIMVAAAGNGDENGIGQDACDFSPASARTALTVGSTDRSDNVASFSNYGPCVNIFAPGVKIRSAWIGSDTATYVSSGTSFSTPFAAGVVATYISERQRQQRANMAPEEVIRAITGMATDGVIHGLDSRSPDLLLYNGIGKDTYSTQESGQSRVIWPPFHLLMTCPLMACLIL
ncbi:hypothetical protein VKS41_007082 [Umbelopsis sp. WA50703]